MERKYRITEGQCFAKVNGRPGHRSGWQVRSIVVPVESLPHARLVNLDDPRDVRIVSCQTIADSQYFKPIGPPNKIALDPESELPTSRARRPDLTAQ